MQTIQWLCNENISIQTKQWLYNENIGIQTIEWLYNENIGSYRQYNDYTMKILLYRQ